MAAFIYQCPVTGYNVQAFIADDPIRRSEDAFQSVSCTVCGQIHLVNPKTGKVVGDRGLTRGRVSMDTQSRPQGGFTSNLWLQFAALVIVVGVLIVLAALYVW